MADAGGKKKKKATPVPLGTFLSESTESKNWADVDDGDEQDEPRGDSYSRRDDYGDRRGGNDDRRGGDRYGGDRRGGDRYGGDRGDRYGGGDRRGGDRYGGDRGDRGGDRYGGDRRGGDRYGDSDRGDRYGGDRRQGGQRRYDAPQKEVPEHGPWNAFVGNLDFSVSEEDLMEFFSEHCKVSNARLLIDRATGRSKGYGYVTFEDRESLVSALEANNFEFHNRPLRVDVAEERADNRSSDGRPRREYSEQPVSRADVVDKWERGKAIPASERPPPRNVSGGDRASGAGRNYSSERGERGERGERAERGERKPLNLQPRSGDSNTQSQKERGASKPSPFGEAKPRDELAIQRKKQEEWEKRGIDTSGSAPVEKRKGDQRNASQEKGGRNTQGKGKAEKDDQKSNAVESTNLYSVLNEETEH